MSRSPRSVTASQMILLSMCLNTLAPSRGQHPLVDDALTLLHLCSCRQIAAIDRTVRSHSGLSLCVVSLTFCQQLKHFTSACKHVRGSGTAIRATFDFRIALSLLSFQVTEICAEICPRDVLHSSLERVNARLSMFWQRGSQDTPPPLVGFHGIRSVEVLTGYLPYLMSQLLKRTEALASALESFVDDFEDSDFVEFLNRMQVGHRLDAAL